MKYSGLIIAAIFAANSAVADSELTMAQTGGDDEATTVLSVKNGKVAYSQDGQVQGIYDVASGAFTHIDHSTQGYMVLDSAAMNELADGLSDMMAQVEAQMASMPPEQREAMMRMMPAEVQQKLRGGGNKKSGIDVKWTGESKKISGYQCEVATISNPSAGEGKGCIAKPGELGLADKDYDALADMFDTMQELASRFGTGPELPNAKQMGGIPIHMTDSTGQTTVLKSLNTDELSSDLFEIPAGYSKRSVTNGM